MLNIADIDAYEMTGMYDVVLRCKHFEYSKNTF